MTAQPDKAKHELNREKRAAPGKSQGQARAESAWSLDQFVVEPSANKVRFHDFSLPLDLMRGLAALQFQYCTPIQSESLPYSLNGHDIVGRAQTGTGKTAAFLISIVNDLINYAVEGQRYIGDVRALVLAPTRELALQIAEDALKLTRFTDIKVHALVGGLDYAKQLKQIESEHCDILVGTPGRLLDFANNQDIHLDQIEILVIDEADRMLDMGFIPQVRRIVRLTPRKEDRQTLLFSATFSDDVIRLAGQWTEQPVLLELGAEKVTTDTVLQKVYITTAVEKFALLKQILSQKKVESVMIFANRRDICRDLHHKLRKKGFKVGILSGDVPQARRLKTLDSFKSGSIRILVATDVAGRGIHVDDVSHVINYTLPEEPQDYIHRIGRTGRAGHSGVSISFACEDDAFLLEPIEKLLGQKLSCIMPDTKNGSDSLFERTAGKTGDLLSV
ncbi:MAG: ATP-dependent RNA helicase RhlB [Porticoccaceae bacterium]|nr:ATP-dependent RNA helicase RhlB [Porticoccaceae bacterium]